MGLFSKKKQTNTTVTSKFTVNVNAKDLTSKKKSEPIPDHLVDGDLPWGWIYANREFTAKIESEYKYFLQDWTALRQGEPIKHYGALKSFVTYMNDAKKLCYSKGECFAFWFSETIASDDYIKTRTKELEKLEKNRTLFQKIWEHMNSPIMELDYDIAIILNKKNGILQSDFVKTFKPYMQQEVRYRLGVLETNGIITRTKNGRSYNINLTI